MTECDSANSLVVTALTHDTKAVVLKFQSLPIFTPVALRFVRLHELTEMHVLTFYFLLIIELC